MRTDQYIGLNPWARTFVEGQQEFLYTEEVTRTFPSGEVLVIAPRKVMGTNVVLSQYDEIEGAFGNTFPLFSYKFSDGREYFEYVQAQPWSSGPCYYLALRDGKGNPVPESLWPQEEIDNA